MCIRDRWKPQGASYDDKGQRVCDNQSCNKCLTKERYALVVDKQKWSDTRAIDRGKSKGLAAWMHCESCDSRMSSDKKSVVYPDGYMPGVREQDRSKATPEMRERMSGGRHGKGGGGSRHAKANAARRSRFRFGGAIRAQPCRTSRAGGGEVGRTKA